MGPTVRGHFLIGGVLFLWVAIWTQLGVHRHAVEESLAEDMSALSGGELSPDSVPALAHLVVGDSAQPLDLRLRVVPAAVDSRLRDRIRIAAGPQEDPHTLLGLVLNPQLTKELQSTCPNVPIEVGVVCDLEQFSRIKAQVYRSLLDQMSRRPEYAAATRVGGNDVPLLVSDLLCQMGEEGRRLAEAHLKKDPKGSSGALGVMALGCAGDRQGEVVDQALQGLIGESGAIGMAAKLECASRRTCTQARSEAASDTPSEALVNFVVGLSASPETAP